jgi:hypothetical protein
MPTISEIRAGLATNLATIAGLRSSATVPDNPSPPIAIVNVSSVDYNQSMQRGLTLYNMTVSVIVSRVDERSGQNRLDGYASTSGAASIKNAIESDRSLGGKVFDLRCSELSNVSTVVLAAGDVTYLVADFAVQVYAE